MTNASLITSLIVASAIAGFLSWLLRRWSATESSSAALASGFGAMIALPILLHPGDGLSRIAMPREALEWLPLGMLGLSLFTLLYSLAPKRASIWVGLGMLSCFAIVARMMWGSVYLRPSNPQWGYASILLVWASFMAWGWRSRINATSHEKGGVLNGAVQLFLLFVVAVNLGLSGSITYFAAGALFAVASAASWIGARRLSQVTPCVTLGLLVLGPTFSETSWWVAALLAFAVVCSVIVGQIESGRRRVVMMVLVMVAALAASSFTGYKFWQSVSSKSNSSGYEAYK
jgi:hypothetical protein